MESQTRIIKAHLEAGLAITAMEALHSYGCFRLSARIYDLKQSGFHVEKRMFELKNGKKIAEYYRP